MPKRRDRRLAAGGQTRPPDSTIRQPVAGAGPGARIIPILLSIAALLIPFAAFLRYSRPHPAPPTSSVYERGLVKPDVDFIEILAENARVSSNTSMRHLERPVLAYVTPWNSKGYDMAKKFSSKFTHISPVWYDLKSEGSKLVLEGHHNADLQWISELRINGDALLLPRVVLEAKPSEMFGSRNEQKKAVELLVAECREMGYDGLVLESWSRWAAYGILHDKELRKLALQFIKQLGQTLHSVKSSDDSNKHLQLIYVIPAPRSDRLGDYDFGLEDFQNLNDDVDGYSLMTYDFSDPYHPGPNAPLGWIRSSMKVMLGVSDDTAEKYRQKIFLGINFYGNDFELSKDSGGNAITGREFLTLLEKYRPRLEWASDAVGEHYFLYTSNNVKHAVFYPTLFSISKRLEEAKTWECGISIWEIGQGLDYFFDLL